MGKTACKTRSSCRDLAVAGRFKFLQNGEGGFISKTIIAELGQQGVGGARVLEGDGTVFRKMIGGDGNDVVGGVYDIVHQLPIAGFEIVVLCQYRALLVGRIGFAFVVWQSDGQETVKLGTITG